MHTILYVINSFTSHAACPESAGSKACRGSRTRFVHMRTIHRTLNWHAQGGNQGGRYPPRSSCFADRPGRGLLLLLSPWLFLERQPTWWTATEAPGRTGWGQRHMQGDLKPRSRTPAQIAKTMVLTACRSIYPSLLPEKQKKKEQPPCSGTSYRIPRQQVRFLELLFFLCPFATILVSLHVRHHSSAALTTQCCASAIGLAACQHHTISMQCCGDGLSLTVAHK
jgi:hypothetical protein